MSFNRSKNEQSSFWCSQFMVYPVPFTTQKCVFQVSGKLSEMKHISPLVAGKQVDVGELKSHPAPMEVHLLNVDHHQVLGDVPVNGECVVTLGCSGFGLFSRQKASELEIKRRKELTFIVSILTFPKAQNNRTMQLGRHLGKSLVPPPAPSWVSCEIRLLWDLSFIVSPGL